MIDCPVVGMFVVQHVEEGVLLIALSLKAVTICINALCRSVLNEALFPAEILVLIMYEGSREYEGCDLRCLLGQQRGYTMFGFAGDQWCVLKSKVGGGPFF